ncbi:MAG: tRNA lysidine(34) synthetase TilS [Clostridia bacterium]|nr:tRNA lysidine(34) synthetase TilS [Clostridia bacterium]
MLNKNLLKANSTVAVALSGGKDSMVLLDLLLKQSKSLNITVKALNVEHGIRGESSIKDSEFVKNYCKEKNVPLLQEKIDCLNYCKASGLSIEEGARKLRYEFFIRAVQSGFCDFVATAHHLSDNVETVLFNLFRGASPSGLTGISKSRNDGKIIRPLLSVTREQIDAYAKENSIPYVTDESNFDDEYSRNFLRLNVIPQIKKLFPEMENAVQRFTEILQKDEEFLLSESKRYLKFEDGCAVVDFNAPSPVFSRAVVLAMKEMGIKKDFVKAHIDALIDLKTANTSKKIHLLNGVVAVKDYNGIVFYKESEIKQIELPFSIGCHNVGKYNLIIEQVERSDDLKRKDKLYIDADKVQKKAKIRFRRNGDEFEKFGGGTKNLGDFLTDKKVPLRERDLIPVVAIGSEILVVCGIEISKKVKVEKNTQKIFSIELKPV